MKMNENQSKDYAKEYHRFPHLGLIYQKINEQEMPKIE